MTSSRRGSLAAPVRWSIDSRTSTALPAVRPSTRSMSVSSAAQGRPLPAATSMIVCASSRRLVELGQEGARADLDVHHERVEPGGELLGEDRGDDERDRLDRAGGVADGVEPAVGGGEVAGLADDRAARLAHGGGEALAVGRRVVAGDRVELVERPAGVAEAAAGDHRHGAAARGDDRREQQRDLVADARRWSACRAPGGRGPTAGPRPSASWRRSARRARRRPSR